MNKIITFLALLLSVNAIAQDETHDFINKDTSITVAGNTFLVYASYPRNMFVANHPDTASRPVLFHMGGAGEVGTDTAKVKSFGPHYWLRNGWDGSITMGNGYKRYPILISIQSTTANPTVSRMMAILKVCLDYYHIKRNSVHCAGLSMGAFSWCSIINGQTIAGDEAGMKMITSLVLLQGQSNGYDGGTMGSAIPFGTDFQAYGHWAKKYGGRLFALEGTADSQTPHLIRDAIADSIGGAAYFANENINGGGHCCWNTMYDPSRTNWQSHVPYGPNVTTGGFPSIANSDGNYITGDNIFRWMYKQGDTTRVGPADESAISKVFIGEYRTWYKRGKKIWSYHNNVMTEYTFGGLEIKTANVGFNILAAIDTEGYVWRTTVGSLVTNRIDTDTLGNAFSNNVYVNSYASVATQKSVYVTIKSDGTLWYFGWDNYQLLSSQKAIDHPIEITPAGKQVKKAILGKNILVLTTDGLVYERAIGGSWVQKTTPRPAVDIGHGNYSVSVAIVPKTTGSQTMGYPFVWGTDYGYWAGTTGYSNPTDITSLWGLTKPIRVISVNTNIIAFTDSTKQLYTVGDNVMGEAGIGDEKVNKDDYPTKYGYDFGRDEYLVGVNQVLPGVKIDTIYSNNFLTFKTVVQDENDSIYYAGEDKSLTSGRGLYNLQEATYRNALDLTTFTIVSPFANVYKAYNFTREALSAGSAQVLTGATSSTLTAVGRAAKLVGAVANDTINYNIASWLWTKVSGPSCTITTPTAVSTSITGLSTGVYTFRILMTDNNKATTTATTTVSILAGENVPPVIKFTPGSKIIFKITP